MNREVVIREIEERYRQLGRSLNEFERRHWAATEAMKLGRGGLTIVSKALRISPNTIKRGIQEIATGQADSTSHTNSRIRKPGGGRKSKKTPLDRLGGARSNKDSAVNVAELPAPGGFPENRHDTVPITTDSGSLPVNDIASDQRPN